MKDLFVGEGKNKIRLIVNEQKLKRTDKPIIDDQPKERTRKAEIERKIKERVKSIIDMKYRDIIEQQYDLNIKNISSYKPLLVKFFGKPINFKNLLSDLRDLQTDYETIESENSTFESFVEQVLYSIEMSKIGAEKDRRNLVKEHVNNFGDFIQKKLKKD